MVEFKGDLHIHSVISPCADLEMSPSNIVSKAKSVGMDIIGIADHNCTKHGPLVRDLAEREGILALMGVEVTTREEVHCLAFFPNEEVLNVFQQFLDDRLPLIPLDVDLFGYQVVVNEVEEIVEELPYLLISGINASIDEVERTVHSLGGIFIPAHVNKPKFSVISQLGFVPFDLKYDALEVVSNTAIEKFCEGFPNLSNSTFVINSDSHFIDQVGTSFTLFGMKSLSFDEVRKALHHLDGRYTRIM